MAMCRVVCNQGSKSGSGVVVAVEIILSGKVGTRWVNRRGCSSAGPTEE